MTTKKDDVFYCGVSKEKVEEAFPVLKEDILSFFKQYIHERYQVHVKKDVLGEKRPWTRDPAIQKFRFTNVRREHDKESHWLIRNISQSENLTYEEKILNSILFRSWNKSSTMEILGGPFKLQGFSDPEKYRPVIEEYQNDFPRYTWFTGAFNSGGLKQTFQFPDGIGYRNGYRKTSEAQEKPRYEANMPIRMFYMIKWAVDNRIFETIQNASTQEEVYNVIRMIPGYGPFLAYQVFVDLTYIPEFPFSENEFTVCGPGCKRGVDRLVKDRDGLSYEEFLFWLRDYQYELLFSKEECQQLFEDLPIEDRYMNVMSIENCFCEISKYLKVVLNEKGRPKQRYEGVSTKKTLFY